MILVKDFYKNVLKNINIEFKEGLTYLKGRNGTGKTTLLNCLAGIDLDYKGRITGNEDIVYLNQNIYFEDRLMVKELIEFILSMDGIKDYEKHYFSSVKKYDDIFDFSKLWNRQVGTLSGGERKLLFISAIFSIERKWYILDEPFNSVDMESKSIIIDMIKRVLDNNSSIIITNHEKLELQAFEEMNVVDLDEINSLKEGIEVDSSFIRKKDLLLSLLIFIIAIIPLWYNSVDYKNELVQREHIDEQEKEIEIVIKDKVIYEEVLNQLNAKEIDDVKTLDKVDEIIIYNQDIIYPEELAKFKKLRRLILVNCNIIDVTFAKDMEELELLDMRGNYELKDISLLSELDKLEYLNVSGTRVIDLTSMSNVDLVVR